MGGVAKLDKLTGVGSVLAGKYRIERVVGSGGMGVVAAARHLRLGSHVAVKFMLPRSEDSDRSVARFLREARTVSRIAGPHVARVFDVDLRDDGVPYIVMEYLEGETLAAALRRERLLGVESVVDDLLAACEALAEAHSLGIVHRDLKPGNLFRARLPGRSAHVLKVLDFGISKTFESKPEEVASITTGKGFVGSPPYMSPEQITSPGNVDSRTDIWSLGVVLYECLTGISPFAASSVGATCARILQEVPPPPSSLRPELPQGIDAAVLRCLARSAADRYPDVLALARELTPFGGNASARILSSLETHWANATPQSVNDLPADSDRGDLSTETAMEPVPSLAGVMQSSFSRLPRHVGVGVGGVAALALVGVAFAGASWLRGRSDMVQASPRPTPALAPSIPQPVPSPEPPAALPPSPTPSPSVLSSKPRGVTRAKPAPRPRPETLPAASALPASSPHVPAPAAVVAPAKANDPEAIYTDRK